MKIDKKTVDMLLTMNDDQLWQALRTVAAASGMKGLIPAERPKDLSKFRALLGTVNDSDLSRAMELMDAYKHPNG